MCLPFLELISAIQIIITKNLVLTISFIYFLYIILINAAFRPFKNFFVVEFSLELTCFKPCFNKLYCCFVYIYVLI